MFGIKGQKKGMTREIIINAEALETRVAIMENGKVEEFQCEHPTEERIVGSVYKGRIQNLEQGLRAAFVDIGMKKNAFIHYWDMIPEDAARLEAENGGSATEDEEDEKPPNRSGNRRGRGGGRGGGRGRGRRGDAKGRKRKTHEDISKVFSVGSEIVVQVSKGAIGTKGPRVTANISIPGRYLVMLPGSKLKGISRKIEDPKERQRLKKVLARLPVPENTGLIVRTVAEGANQRSIVRDMRALTAIWADMQQKIQGDPVPCCVYQEPDLMDRTARDWLTEDVDRIVVDSRERFERVRDVAKMFGRRIRSRIQLYEGEAPIFSHFDVDRQLAEAFHRKVDLKSGGHIIFEETEALIAIDVNTGRHKSKSHEESILEVNLEAVEEAARQLRLRNVGGLVMLDLIDMRLRKHQNAVYRAFKASLTRDKARTNVLPISKLGILEMSRQRVEESLLASMYVDCPNCRGRGRIRSPLAMSVEIQRQIAAVIRRHDGKKDLRLQIVVNPMVLSRLKEKDEKILIDLESRFTGQLLFKSDASMHHEGFQIVDVDAGQTVYSDGK